MTTIPAWFVGNRNPSITETITAAGVPVDLTGRTVQFRARIVGTPTLIVDQPATVVSAPAGTVRYDWSAADTAANGALADEHDLLVWWTVTTTAGGRTQDLSEALITVRDHLSPAPPAYVELEQLKSTLSMTGYTFADQDLLLASRAASRAIDNLCGRRFYLDTATTDRYYQPDASMRLLPIDDLSSTTSLVVSVDRDGDGTYEETWTNGTDFVLEPFNAPAKFWPYDSLRLRWRAGRWFPWGTEKGVKVTGLFGWPKVPEDIQTATAITAAKIVKRTREAPFGIVTSGTDVGVAMRIVRFDPEVHPIVASYVRGVPYV